MPGDAAPAAPLTVLDVRWRLGGPSGRTDYLAGHIPGAAFLDLDADVCGPPGVGGRHPLPDRRARQLPSEPEPVYTVRFAAAELFGEGDHTVTIDLWESYLRPAAAEEPYL